MATIENRSFGFYKGITAGLALETLPTRFGFAKPNDVVLVLALQLAIVGTGLIWTKVACLGKFRHPTPPLQVVDGCHKYILSLNNSQGGDYQSSLPG
jgi:hypothetical protein